MNLDARPPAPDAPAPDEIFREAVGEHQAGRLVEAAQLYRKLLETDPTHPVANHNLGVVAVQMEQPAAGLPFFLAALESDPTQGKYWLSYVDALINAGNIDDARHVLKLGKQQGLEGREVDSLTSRLADGNWTTAHGTSASKPSRAAGTHKGKTPSPQDIDSLITLFNAGRLDQAAERARTMTTHFPGHWVGWKMLGVVLQQLGRNAEALIPMRKAVKLAPMDAEAHNNLGIILKSLGHLEESASSYRRALKINANYVHAHGNLGATLQKLGRPAEAEASYRTALSIDPKYTKAWSNLGTVLHDQKRFDEAEATYRQVLRLNPNDSETHRNLGITLDELGRLEESEACIRRALEITPNDIETQFNLGAMLQGSGRAKEAETIFRRSVALQPENALAHNNLGTILLDLSRSSEAEESFRRALKIQPDFSLAWSNLGVSLRDQGRLEEAETSFRSALAINPDFRNALGNLGVALHDLGRLEEAVASCRRALEIDPERAVIHSNMLFCLSQIAEISPQELFAEHCRFGTQFEPPFRTNRPIFSNTPDPERRLRIGFVSADFRNHAIAYFVEPILAALSQFHMLELHAYYSHVIEDEVTRRLRSCFDCWNPVAGLSDEALATLICGDGIDILIDLSGHTSKNRLLAFARKPAPLQASWMGYPGTTGLGAMDYYLADGRYLPAGKFDNQYTEKIVRLPASAPFLPSHGAPPVGRLPALDNGYLTFASFNRIGKLSHAVVSVWARLLRALPDARMILGAMREGEKCETLLGWFDREGIPRQRLALFPRSDMKSYLGQHNKVDICLDTFPYNGGTTTLHALWMGVPTISLAGNTTAGRTGASILAHVGLDDFVALDADDFARKGASWTGRLAALSEIRMDLRSRIEASAISQPQVIAANLEQAFRTMWRRWCENQPPESFETSLEQPPARVKELRN
jgi:predicted O-linked N-acetylglucosamine transferase (SPINDLY family)